MRMKVGEKSLLAKYYVTVIKKKKKEKMKQIWAQSSEGYKDRMGRQSVRKTA